MAWGWIVTYSDGTTDTFSDELTLEALAASVDDRKSVLKIERVTDPRGH